MQAREQFIDPFDAGLELVAVGKKTPIARFSSTVIREKTRALPGQSPPLRA
jgi:hypothetical protein